MVLSNELWQKPPSGPTGLLNAGVYADGSDGYSHSPNGDTYYTRFAVSFWYRNDYATSIGTYMMGGNHGNGADHGMTCVGVAVPPLAGAFHSSLLNGIVFPHLFTIIYHVLSKC